MIEDIAGGRTYMQWVQIQGKILYTYTHSGVIYTSEVRLKLKAALKSSKKNVLQPWETGLRPLLE